MEDVLLPTRPTGSSVDAVETMLPPHPFFEPVPMAVADTAAFADSSDRLVRHLFDVGLQLHTLRAVFDRRDATAAEVKAAGEAVGVLVDDLDMLIRDAGLAMLALTLERTAAESGNGNGNGYSGRRRRRHRIR
ncbi:hypothetical protein [Nocardia mexicana]|uniref:Uncharacterized protein n=1 Tax=Nocardia mexicana TaxID=279262 RepID=A0A370H3D7_9NOCA|nr:hypothetical protein [Nocardia mexicana]RDI50537.1 hypothetical protein DFR68_10513 [Nocardia mexicana]